MSGSSGILTEETKDLDLNISAVVEKSGSLANVMTGTQATGGRCHSCQWHPGEAESTPVSKDGRDLGKRIGTEQQGGS